MINFSLVRYAPTSAPPFEPDIYNEFKSIFNCYAYALRLKEQGWAHAGQIRQIEATATEEEKKRLNLASLTKLLQKDGLEQVRVHGIDPEKSHIIAAFVQAGKGYHFFSLDEGNIWSHKLGEKPVQQIPENVRIPSEGDINGSHQFVGYFRINPEKGISYYPRLRAFLM